MSCLDCKLFIGCGDPKRSHNYKCSKFTVKKIKVEFGALGHSDALDYQMQTGILTPDQVDTSELHLVDLLDELLNPANQVPFDLRIDDRDLPEFANFYEFCISKNGANQAPFSRQLALATHVFSEWCPRCSHPKFADITKIPVAFPAISFPDKVQFLEFGKCPKCGITKSELVNGGELNFYTELAACIGQRGGKSAILGLMVPYLIHKYLKLQNPTQVLGLMRNSQLIGTVTALTYGKAVELLWNPIHSVLSESPWFCIAEGSLITLADGSTKPIETIVIGDRVKTLEGASEVLNVFDNGIQECFEVETESGHIVPPTDKHQIRCLAPDGLSLIWKPVSELTEDDFVVVE